MKKIIEGRFGVIKPVTKKEIELLKEHGIIKHKGNVFVNNRGQEIAYYRTRGAAAKIYLEDWYANQAKKLYEN